MTPCHQTQLTSSGANDVPRRLPARDALIISTARRSNRVDPAKCLGIPEKIASSPSRSYWMKCEVYFAMAGCSRPLVCICLFGGTMPRL
jgi:hypothetical protein